MYDGKGKTKTKIVFQERGGDKESRIPPPDKKDLVLFFLCVFNHFKLFHTNHFFFLSKSKKMKKI